MGSVSERRVQELNSYANDRLFAIGSIQQSVLTEVQFQAQQSDKWVLMDGRDITGSALAGITGWANLPDASGRFLRSSGGDADPTVGGLQSQATAVNGLGLSGTSPTLSTNTFADPSHTHGSSALSTLIHRNASTIQMTTRTLSGAGYFSDSVLVGSSGNSNVEPMFVGTAIDGDTDAPSSTMNVSINGGSYSVSSSDTETRPVNITVNTFIKIN